MNQEFSVVECSLSLQENPETGIGFFRFDLPASPNTVPLIVGDVLSNLRASLDYLIWQIVDSNGIAEPSKSNMFPICNSNEGFDQQLKGNRLRGVPDTAIEIVRSMQPYLDEASGELELLNKLCNEDKHRDLHYCVSVASEVQLVAMRDGNVVIEMVIGNDELRNGEIFGGIGFNPKLFDGVNAEVFGKAMAHIAFRDKIANYEEAMPVASTLDAIMEHLKYEVIDRLFWDYVT